MEPLRIARALLPAVLSFCVLTGCGGGGGTDDGGNGGGGGSGTGTGGIPIFWYRYGGDNTVFGYSVRNTVDNGFVMAGWTVASGTSPFRIYLLKTDSRGSVRWQRAFGGSDNAAANAVVQAPDNGFLVAGVRGFAGGDWGDFYLLKTDASGNFLWEKTHPGKGLGRMGTGGYLDVDLARSGGTVDGYVLTGSVENTVPNQYELMIRRTDLDGNLLWTRQVTGQSVSWELGTSVIQARDGGFVAAGSYNPYSSDNAASIAKFAENGNLQWNRRFAPGVAWDIVQAPAPDDGFVLVGAVPDGKGKGQTDLLILKTDGAGNYVKSRTFGGSGMEVGYSISRVSDNGYLVAGQTESYSPADTNHPEWTFLQSDAYLVRVDANLDPLWIRVKGNATPTGDGANSVAATPDNGFIVGGGSGLKGLLAKFDSLGLNVNLGSKDLTLSPSVNPGVIGFASAKDTVGAGVSILDLGRNATETAMAVLVDVANGTSPSFCAGGGGYTDNLTPGPLAAGSVMEVDFDDCVLSPGPDNVTLNGRLVLTVTAVSGNVTGAAYVIAADLALDNVTATDDAGTNRIDGSYTFVRDASGGTVADNVLSGATGFLTLVEQSPSRTITLTDFSAFYLAAPGPLFATGPAAGTLSVTDLSESVILTIEAATRLQGPEPDLPSSGTVRVEASDGSYAEATVQPPDEALISVDEDGDGTVDGTMTILWELLY